MHTARNYAAGILDLQERMEGKSVVLDITRVDFFSALADPLWRPGVFNYAHAALSGAEGAEFKLKCFVCETPWALDRPPAVMVLMLASAEGLAPGEALIAGICPHCIRDEVGFDVAVRRMFHATHDAHLVADQVGHA